ncbi:hypothetical protein HMPREF9455_02898 [Dysgonomonas gadei ATCC BAA-286]|uniref:Uncharacterized protein n=1 Tax=Dysgonomonas gadei ATCC BAA-286 TaxID=742766 RepID=F5J0N1_9BACT|nr:hypothetical protein HMPREF9455_02898 [Dysgonomonas gadei ATCC BAA-286]
MSYKFCRFLLLMANSQKKLTDNKKGKKCQVCQVFTPTLSNTDIFIQGFKKQGRSMNNPVIFKP